MIEVLARGSQEDTSAMNEVRGYKNDDRGGKEGGKSSEGEQREHKERKEYVIRVVSGQNELPERMNVRFGVGTWAPIKKGCCLASKDGENSRHTLAANATHVFAGCGPHWEEI